MSNGGNNRIVIGLLSTLLALCIAVISAMAGHISTRSALALEVSEKYVPRAELTTEFTHIKGALGRIETAVNDHKNRGHK